MQEIMRLAHEFLQNFCAGNQQNQALLHKHINLFLNPGVRLEACLEICVGRRVGKQEERRTPCSFAVVVAGTCYEATFIPTGNILINTQEDVNTPHLFGKKGRRREEEVVDAKVRQIDIFS